MKIARRVTSDVPTKTKLGVPMELEEFAELASGTPLSEREKTLLADMKILADLHKFDIVIVGGNYNPISAVDMFFGLPRMAEPRGINKSHQRMLEVDFADIETRVMGKRPDLMVFDDVYDEIAEKYGRISERGSAKSMAVAEHLYKMAYPPRVGADQVKGPKGPRGKWGKL